MFYLTQNFAQDGLISIQVHNDFSQKKMCVYLKRKEKNVTEYQRYTKRHVVGIICRSRDR